MAQSAEQAVQLLIYVGRLRNSELDFQRIPITREQVLLDLVRQGKYREICLSPFDKLEPNLGLMAKDPLTQYTYLVVAAVTLFSRIAVEEGVSPDDSFDLSDALLFWLSHQTTSEAIHEVYETSAIMYAKMIDSTKSKSQSYQVSRIQNYISRNIYKKITLQEIAAHLGISVNYMCNIFSRETGLSIHNYIQREKIEIACHLLSHSDGSIAYIAGYMGFQTQSNFTAVFRKWKGMTPLQYRKTQFREVL